MNFPVWEVGWGLPMLIAVVAILHVVIAHFAIGGGFFLAIYEGLAQRQGDMNLLNYVRRHSRFFLLLTLIFGAMTGVWIWFTIGLINPTGTSSLIHIFVWLWATEWVMFIVEITSALVYYFGWDRLSPHLHRKVMWVYVGAAWGSLVVINGIVTFMLTPGGWLADGNIWKGFFNPTYFPSLVFRTLLSLLMAGLFAFITGSRISEADLKRKVLRIAGGWSLMALALMVPAALWYYLSLPEGVGSFLAGSWRAVENSRTVLIYAALVLALGVVVSPLIRGARMSLGEAIALLVVGTVLFGSFEWFREAARKPYIIWGYLYSNGIRQKEVPTLKQAGVIGTAKWVRSDPSLQGKDLYRNLCAPCHSLTGYNPLATRIAEKGWNAEELTQLVMRIEHFRGAMPPFVGNGDEASAIAQYLTSEAQKTGITPLPRDGKVIWERNCGLCHTLQGFRPLKDALSGYGIEDLKEILLTSEELSPAMPPFMGSEEEAKRLAEYLHTSLPVSSTEKSSTQGDKR
ncbi:MAG: c-type cytochrome [bacterium]